MVSNCRDGKEALNLAHGSGTLVFELGVEEIAAADGGDVEAYSDPSCQFLVFSLFLYIFLALAPRASFVGGWQWVVRIQIVVSRLVDAEDSRIWM
jgi:hypothetical protein